MLFKKRYTLALASAIMMLLAGCATPLPEMGDDGLCQHMGENMQSKTDRVPGIRAELQRRNLLTQSELQAVDRSDLLIGMSRCGMFAVKGIPIGRNETTTAAGTSTQWIFQNTRTTGRREYVYTRNERVTAWQN
ncbi:MAG: hypothetical protein K2X75_02290 [Burkholderiaceae bacterium]|jgi:hypothetical protein|nr:hypothetical protein [Burkholderiaceae bacterium]